jgi:acetyl-CoA decarbonylase/synthase complex subunit gamma
MDAMPDTTTKDETMTNLANAAPPGAGTSCGCQSASCERPAAEPLRLTKAPGTLSSEMTWRDRLGTLRVRLGIGRMNYRVRPGLYAMGRPTAESPVLVSANFKLSVDHLRTAVRGLDVWILVLDTHGINVWCAAGKGLFGTDEVVRQVMSACLSARVSHRKLVLPQLAAPGVAAHEVKQRTGFRVVYGPVRAADIPAFLAARMTATPEMRQVRYGWRDRAILIPVEVVTGARYPIVAAAALALLSALAAQGTSLAGAVSAATTAAALTFVAFLAGTALGPLLLPWLPGRPFGVKGAILGLLVAAALAVLGWPAAAFSGSWVRATAWALLLPALTSFVLMNFTGSSTFTSLSGVLREMRVAVPLQIAAAVVGLALWVAALFGGTV